MATYPLDTLGPTITSAGISIPSYSDIYLSLCASFQAIYGSDVYIPADSQDGQWIGVLAKAINDSNQAAVTIFQGYSPTYASGNALAAQVKINGLTKLSPSKSSVPCLIIGQAGKTIIAGVVADASGIQWDIPANTVIPIGGEITVTATCQKDGSIPAAAGAVQIATVQNGWQSAEFTTAATLGAPVEEDPALRLRQTFSVAIPSQTVLEGMLGAIKNLPDVTAARVYENDTGGTDANGIPAGNIAFVVQGGDATEIATTIMVKKTQGVPTYGTTTESLVDSTGNPHDVNFSFASGKRILVAISLHGFSGYTTIIGDKIKAAVADYINDIGIGNKVMLVRLQLPAQLYGSMESKTYEIVTIAAAISPTTPGSSDVAIAFNQIATCQASDISITTV